MIQLKPETEDLIKKKVGPDYADPDKVVREALAALEEHEARYQKLKAEVLKGYEQAQRGEFSSKTINQVADEVLARHHKPNHSSNEVS